MKRHNQCNFGDCEKSAEVILATSTEERPMCVKHAALTIELRVEMRQARHPLPKVALHFGPAQEP